MVVYSHEILMLSGELSAEQHKEKLLGCLKSRPSSGSEWLCLPVFGVCSSIRRRRAYEMVSGFGKLFKRVQCTQHLVCIEKVDLATWYIRVLFTFALPDICAELSFCFDWLMALIYLPQIHRFEDLSPISDSHPNR